MSYYCIWCFPVALHMTLGFTILLHTSYNAADLLALKSITIFFFFCVEYSCNLKKVQQLYHDSMIWPRSQLHKGQQGPALAVWKMDLWTLMIQLLKLLEMTLPKLRYKQVHMPKSVVWVLLDSKYEKKREKQWKE